MKEKNTRGITLIALIITVIVMLILAIVTVNFVIDSKMMNAARTAGDKTETAYVDEQNLDSTIQVGNKSLGNYLAELTEKNETGEENGEAGCQHEFGDWEVIQAATFKITGEQKRVCTKCGVEEEQEIPVKEVPAGSTLIITPDKDEYTLGDTINFEVTLSSTGEVITDELEWEYEDEFKYLGNNSFKLMSTCVESPGLDIFACLGIGGPEGWCDLWSDFSVNVWPLKTGDPCPGCGGFPMSIICDNCGKRFESGDWVECYLEGDGIDSYWTCGDPSCRAGSEFGFTEEWCDWCDGSGEEILYYLDE